MNLYWERHPDALIALQSADALIFDIDGTLWDSTDTVAEAWNRALLSCVRDGVLRDAPHLSGAVLRGEFGKPMEDIFLHLIPATFWTSDAYGDGMQRLTAACYIEEETQLKRRGGVLYPDVAETLERLHKKRPLYIVSNCQLGYIERFYESTGLAHFFSGSLCYGDTGERKGITMRRLMEEKQCGNAVYIGDIAADALAAEEAGATFIWASYGFGSVDEALCRGIISDFCELSLVFA